VSKRIRLVQGIPNSVQGVLLTLCFLLVGYWGWSYSGPFRWLAEVQMRALGGYYWGATWIVLSLMCFVVVAMVLRLLRERAGLDVASLERRAWFRNIRPTYEEFESVLAFVMLAAILWYFAIPGIQRQLQAGECARVQIGSINSGELPDSTWLEVEGGVARWNERIEWQHGARYRYVPLVAPGWTRQEPAHMLLKVNSVQLPKFDVASASYRGMRDFDSLPTPVEKRFKEAGIHLSSVTVLDFESTPDNKRVVTWVFAGVALMLTLAAAVCALVPAWRHPLRHVERWRGRWR
jgi:hypothetical protein